MFKHDGGIRSPSNRISVCASVLPSGTVRLGMRAARRVGQAVVRANDVVAQHGADAALPNFAKIGLSKHIEVLLTT